MSDLHFDRALRGAARRGRPEGVCPDAAALASYVDRSLSLAEHAALEAHVASCPACMEHLALLTAADAPEAPADASDAWSFERIFGSWRWLVPAATVVLVVAVWLRLPAPREAALPTSLEKTAEAPRPVTVRPFGWWRGARRRRRQARRTQAAGGCAREARCRQQAGSVEAENVGRRTAAVRPGRCVQEKGARRRCGQRTEEPCSGQRSPCCSSRRATAATAGAAGRRRGEGGCRSAHRSQGGCRCRGSARMPRTRRRHV